jgi:BirA family biotin operon repressor/biotin-[acetyl-CoA-carboxylase] ligase
MEARSTTDSGADRQGSTYDGVPAPELPAWIGAGRVHLYDVVGSTMDVAHALAAGGAPDGTIVLADSQLAGRGRHGRPWRSTAGQGVWFTAIERPRDPAAVDVLSLRVGIALADAIDPLAASPVRLKWPNDLYVAEGKLAGILVEARWRDARLDWVAIGIGLNVRPPELGGSLRPDVSRLEVLSRIVPALRDACRRPGSLTAEERTRFAMRDLAHGRVAVSPAAGTVAGIDQSGALLIAGADGVKPFRSGSLVFREET